ncbi:MAG: mutY [Segetibacter sp.]|nr:mutY [Segetibacter sp.]
MKNVFTQKLIKWHENQNKRIMPWKGEKDAYRIWISEIILQQTRVEQGLSYYENFIQSFPTLGSLALAEDEMVFKLWEGLGYYSRCRNLIHSARHIHYNLGGKFPEKYDDLLQLKGIGPYTAAAISSFAYGLPHAVVDGNVFRVLSRVRGDFTAIDTTLGKQHYNEIAHCALDRRNTGEYNQAIMDFGATVCKPMLPLCTVCILNNDCKAFAEGWVNQLPVKEKRIIRKNRYLDYFVFTSGKTVLVKNREHKDIWQNLNEFYLYETEKESAWNAQTIQRFLQEQLGVEVYTVKKISDSYAQQLTHQNIKGRFIVIDLKTVPKSLTHFKSMAVESFAMLAFPKFINMFLDDYPLFGAEKDLDLL